MFFSAPAFLFAQNPFVTIWKTDNPGVSNSDQIQIPAYGSFTYEWNELGPSGETGSGTGDGTTTINFPNSGTYEVSITPSGSEPFHRIHFDDESDKDKILGITAWGDAAWSSFEEAFTSVTYPAVFFYSITSSGDTLWR